MNKYGYRFSFGPWNIHEGADPFGPTVRPARALADKLKVYQELGFDAVQFHDDDAVPNLDALAPAQIRRLVEISRTVDWGKVQALIAARDYEELDWLILSQLTGR